MKLESKCQCKNSTVVLKLPVDDCFPGKPFQLRECDCDYCHSHQAKWFSDPDGEIEIISTGLKIELQGSGQAKFLLCQQCQMLLAVTFGEGDAKRGAVNGSLFSYLVNEGELLQVSPQKLKPDEKRQRWQSVWSKVKISLA